MSMNEDRTPEFHTPTMRLGWARLSAVVMECSCGWAVHVNSESDARDAHDAHRHFAGIHNVTNRNDNERTPR